MKFIFIAIWLLTGSVYANGIGSSITKVIVQKGACDFQGTKIAVAIPRDHRSNQLMLRTVLYIMKSQSVKTTLKMA